MTDGHVPTMKHLLSTIKGKLTVPLPWFTLVLDATKKQLVIKWSRS